MLRPAGPAAACLAPGIIACGQLLQRGAPVVVQRLQDGVTGSSSSCQQCTTVAAASVASPSFVAGTEAPAAAAAGLLAVKASAAQAGTRSSGTSGGSSAGGGTGRQGGSGNGWRWNSEQRMGWGPAGLGAAAAAAGFACSAIPVALADAASKEQPSMEDALAAAQSSLAAVWGEVQEDAARVNAALPPGAPTITGEAPTAALASGAVEVVVPVREGADADAVLKEMRHGLGSKGSMSYSESYFGASRRVNIEARPDSSKPESWLRMQLFVPPPGGVEQAQVTVCKRSAFTPEELAALGRLVRAANLTTARDRPAQGASARRHGLHGAMGSSGEMNEELMEMFSELSRGGGPLGPFGALLAGPLQQMFEELQRGLGPQGGAGGGEEGEGGGFSRGGGAFVVPPPGWSSGPEAGGGGGGFSGRGQIPMQQPSQRRDGGGSVGADGHDWGSAEAKRAVDYLLSIGAQVFPPGNKAEMDWGILAGYDEQKRTIEDCLLLPLLRPDVYTKLAAATRKTPANIRPRAVLFEGPPGTGKTTSARVISSQAAVPLIYVPLEAVLSKWYGESEQQLGQVFKAAEALGGAIIFLDELDALGGNRSAGGLHEVSRRLLSVLLREMEGFDAATKRTVVIGATNRKADLDPALLSRFDLVMTFGLPDTACRQLILRQYARQLTDPELQQLAARTPGMSGRDLRDVCEHTERRWASKIIRGEVADSALPPLSEYLASAEERATAVQHVQRQAEAAERDALSRLLGASGAPGAGGLARWLSGR